MNEVGKTPSQARTPLVPLRRMGPRVGTLAALVLFLLIGSPSLLSFLGFTLVTALVLGTFPRAYVSPTEFEQQLIVMFISVRVTRWPLNDCGAIETDVETRVPWWSGFVFGIANLLWVWALDHLFPWFGGDFKIWLRTLSGKRILAWQGDGESRFRENLKILERQSGLPLTRG